MEEMYKEKLKVESVIDSIPSITEAINEVDQTWRQAMRSVNKGLWLKEALHGRDALNCEDGNL